QEERHEPGHDGRDGRHVVADLLDRLEPGHFRVPALLEHRQQGPELLDVLYLQPEPPEQLLQVIDVVDLQVHAPPPPAHRGELARASITCSVTTRPTSSRSFAPAARPLALASHWHPGAASL